MSSVASSTHPHAFLPSVLCVLAAAALFGTVGTARVLGPPIDATALAAARLGLGSALLVGVALVAGGRFADLARVVRRPAAMVAAAGMAAFQVTFLAAVQMTGVAVGTLVAIGSAPLFAGLLSGWVTRIWLGATALSVLGLALLVTDGEGSTTGLSWTGTALALGAGASYATYLT